MRKLIYKITAIVLALICVVNFALGNQNKIQAKTANDNVLSNYTNADQWVADCLIGRTKDKNGKPIFTSNISGNPIQYKFAYKEMSEGIINKPWLLVGAVFWKNAKDCLSSDFVDLVSWDKIMYESLIMNWLSYEFESDDYKGEFE